MIEISTPAYCTIAARLRQAIGQSDYFNGTIEYETEEFYSTLTLTAIIYRRTEIMPEGPRRPISDIVPIWWEFTTVQECGNVLNCFSFSELKPFLIDYD